MPGHEGETHRMTTSMATHVTPDSSSTGHSLRVRFDAFELDEANARLLRDGRAVALAPTPFALLCALVRQPRSLLTKHALLDDVWGHQFVSESVLKTAISDLRATLVDDPKQPRYIETISRRGYRFIGAVTHTATVGGTRPDAPDPAAERLPAWSSIGRSDALESLGTAWQLAAAGKRQIVWIAGEAGVGKTTLIERFMAEAGDIRCAHGQCVEQYGEGEPYLPVLEALTALCRRDAALAELIRAVAPTWLLQLPWLSSTAEREALRRELSGTGQARMLREMGELLDRYTADRPLLLVTEDLHWSDQATVQLIDYVARRRTGTRLLWLASFRLSEIIAADHPLATVRQELRLHRLCEEIVLDAFSEKEVGEYLAAHIPELAADETFVRALHDRTDGLPLLVADVVNDLARKELASAGDSGACLRLASMAIPETLSGIVERYIEQLEPDQRELLQARERLRRRIQASDRCPGAGTRRRIGGPIVRRAGAPAAVAEGRHAGTTGGAARCRLCVPARAVPGGVLQAHRPARSCRTPSQRGSVARARAGRGTECQRGRAGLAFRAWP